MRYLLATLLVASLALQTGGIAFAASITGFRVQEQEIIEGGQVTGHMEVGFDGQGNMIGTKIIDYEGRPATDESAGAKALDAAKAANPGYRTTTGLNTDIPDITIDGAGGGGSGDASIAAELASCGSSQEGGSLGQIGSGALEGIVRASSGSSSGGSSGDFEGLAPVVDKLGSGGKTTGYVNKIHGPDGQITYEQIDATGTTLGKREPVYGADGKVSGYTQNVLDKDGKILGAMNLPPTQSAGDVLGGILKSEADGLVRGLQSEVQGLVQGGVQSAINKLTGGSTTGRVIGQLLSGNSVGSITSNLLGGGSLGRLAGGVVNKAAQSILGATGLGNVLGGVTSKVSGLLGGGAASLVSGPLGLVTGGLLGGAVPVSNSTIEKRTTETANRAKEISAYQKTYIQKVCTQDIIVKKARIEATAQAAAEANRYAAEGRDGGPIFETRSLGEQINDTNATIVRASLGDLEESDAVPSLIPAVQRSVVERELSNTFAEQVKCPPASKIDVVACRDDIKQCGATGEERRAMRLAIKLYPGCTEEGLQSVVQSYITNRNAVAYEDRKQQLAQGQGYYNRVTCSDGSSASSQEDCLALQTYRAVTPGTAQREVHIQEGLTSPSRQQENADEIGELVNDVFAELGRSALTSVKGLLGLTKKSSSGEGSPLDRLTQTTQGNGATQVRASLLGEIDAALIREDRYQTALADMALTLGAAENAYQELRSCYQGLAVTPRLGITEADALSRAAAASSTIDTTLEPKVREKASEFTASQGVIASLESLRREAASAQSAGQVSVFMNRLRSMPGVHTDASINQVEDDREALSILMDGVVQDAANELTECRQF